MSLTINRNYHLPTGQLETDFDNFVENFQKIDEDVTELHQKVEDEKSNVKNELKAEMTESFALMANLSLYALERTQKIKIGVEI